VEIIEISLQVGYGNDLGISPVHGSLVNSLVARECLSVLGGNGFGGSYNTDNNTDSGQEDKGHGGVSVKDSLLLLPRQGGDGNGVVKEGTHQHGQHVPKERRLREERAGDVSSGS
jgi:hypothetical protein